MFGVDVTHVQPLKERRLQVTFSDGVTAVLEMDRVLKHGYGGVFSPLMDEAYFAKVRVDSELGQAPARRDLHHADGGRGWVEIKNGTLQSIIRQPGLPRSEFEV